MVKGFVAGVLWGGVVAGAGLGVVSVMSPMGGPAKLAVEAPAEPEAQKAQATELAENAPAAETVAAKPAEPEAVAADPVAEPKAEEKPAEDAAKPAEGMEMPVVADDATANDAAASPGASAEVPSPEAPKPAEAPATQPANEAPVAELPKVAEAPTVDASEAAPVADLAPIPAPDATAEAQETLLTPAPELPEQKPAAISPDPVQPATEAPAPDAVQPEATQPSAPDAGFDDQVAGVTTGRLPAIGKETAEPAAEAAPALSDLPAYRRFARSFDNAGGKPLFAVLLVDPGTPELDRAQLAALSVPVTFVVDPLAENAAAASAIYRAAGQEVVMLATGIPKGAKASDLEQTFAAYAAALPEAVAVLDLSAGGFQDDRALATDVVGLIQAQGRGVLTYDRGLNAADQVARRDVVPAGLVFRSLDDDGEDAPLIRRYLDRAAFKAAQEGRVVVVGTARPETIAALLEWTVEGRASSVALAPVTAVLSVE